MYVETTFINGCLSIITTFHFIRRIFNLTKCIDLNDFLFIYENRFSQISDKVYR